MTRTRLGSIILAASIAAMGMISVATTPAATTANTERKGERMDLWAGQAPVGDGKFVAADASILVYRPAKANGASVVICPGGAYGCLGMETEGHSIARWLNLHGIVGVVLVYRMPHGNPFIPLLDAQRAIRMVRSKAREWNCDPKRIGIMGFSAGGHLAATAATHFDNGDARSADPVNRISSRPDFAILIYPIITMGPMTHAGSRDNLLGKNPKPEILELFSNEKQATEQTPPAFLAHAQDDSVVPPANSQMFFEALQAHKVAAAYLKLPTGGHGLDDHSGPMWDSWQNQSLQWLAEQNMIPLDAASSSNRPDKAGGH